MVGTKLWLSRKMMRRMPILSLLPLAPALAIGSLIAALRALARIRRLERRLAAGGSAPA